MSKRFKDDTFFAGGDLGLIADSSALAIVRLQTAHNFIDLVKLREIRPQKGKPLKLSDVVATFAGDMKEFNVHAFMADGWSREPAREHAGANAIAILDRPEGTHAKRDMYIAMRNAMREGRLRLGGPELRLRAQLRAVQAKPVSGGGISIGSPRRGGHGDLVSALVLAVWQALEHQSGALFDDQDFYSRENEQLTRGAYQRCSAFAELDSRARHDAFMRAPQDDD